MPLPQSRPRTAFSERRPPPPGARPASRVFVPCIDGRIGRGSRAGTRIVRLVGDESDDGRETSSRRLAPSARASRASTVGATTTTPAPPLPRSDRVAKSKGRIRRSGRRVRAPWSRLPVSRPEVPPPVLEAVSGASSVILRFSSISAPSRSASGPSSTSGPMLRRARSSMPLVSAASPSLCARGPSVARADGSSGRDATVPSSRTSSALASASPPTMVGRMVSTSPATPMPRIRPRSAPSAAYAVMGAVSARGGGVARLMIDGCDRPASDASTLTRSA